MEIIPEKGTINNGFMVLGVLCPEVYYSPLPNTFKEGFVAGSGFHPLHQTHLPERAAVISM